MITASTDLRALARVFDTLGVRAPKAMAETLNILAASARKEVIRTLPNYFTIRSPWLARSLRFAKSTPRTLLAYVGTGEKEFVDQHEGGVRTGTKIPQVGPGRPRSAKARRVPPSKAFSAIRAKAKRRTWFGDLPHGGVGLWQEVGKAKNPGRRLLYVLPDKQVVAKRWPMNDIIARQAAKRLSGAVDQAWAKWAAGIPRVR